MHMKAGDPVHDLCEPLDGTPPAPPRSAGQRCNAFLGEETRPVGDVRRQQHAQHDLALRDEQALRPTRSRSRRPHRRDARVGGSSIG